MVRWVKFGVANVKSARSDQPIGYDQSFALAVLPRPRLDHHEGLGERMLVSDGEMDEGDAAGRRDRLEPLRSAAGQAHGRLPARQIDHAHVAPEHAAPEAGPERLGASLLGGETFAVGGGAVLAAFRLAALYIGEAARDEALAMALQRLLDATDVAKVAADADDHGAAPGRPESGRRGGIPSPRAAGRGTARRSLDPSTLRALLLSVPFPVPLRSPGWIPSVSRMLSSLVHRRAHPPDG